MAHDENGALEFEQVAGATARTRWPGFRRQQVRV
jgi:hypothetical protein